VYSWQKNAPISRLRVREKLAAVDVDAFLDLVEAVVEHLLGLPVAPDEVAAHALVLGFDLPPRSARRRPSTSLSARLPGAFLACQPRWNGPQHDTRGVRVKTFVRVSSTVLRQAMRPRPPRSSPTDSLCCEWASASME
jgi:hypothetical protein